MHMATSLLVSLLLASSVAAHGYVSQVSIAGKDYPGNVPNGKTNPSILRQISDIGPVKGASNPDLFCGLNAQVASDVAQANPGDTIGVKWVGGGGQNWPHNTGPMLTYLASCGSTPCNQFDNTGAKWFKIQQEGRTKPGGPWTQAALLDPSTDVVNVKLPSNLAPGNYLFRHEIIALHLGVTLGGAEFYPSCSQIQVGGSGTGQPEDDELVTFPGAYSDNDPGIFDPDVYDVNAPYTFPGPNIAKFVTDADGSGNSTSTSGSGSSGSNGNSGSDSGSNSGSGSGSGSGSVSSTIASSQTCKLNKRSGTGSEPGFAKRWARSLGLGKRSTHSHSHMRWHQDIVPLNLSSIHENINSYRPQQLSRVMRDLVPEHWGSSSNL